MTINVPRIVDIPALQQLWKQAFGDPDAFVDAFFRAGFCADRCRCIYLDGQLAAALYWFDCTWQGKKLAYLYAVATDRAFRGRGLCRTLMEDTHRHLQRLGYAGAVLVPGSAELFSLYGKLGYSAFCPLQTCSVEAGSVPVAVSPIGARTFETLRRQYLPAGAVLQEQETTAFLAEFVEFYRGEGLLMCLSRENGDLYFQEYLGDPEQLPGVIATLGGRQGILRLPGGDTPTAMYRSFDGTVETPAYLGIALN